MKAFVLAAVVFTAAIAGPATSVVTAAEASSVHKVGYYGRKFSHYLPKFYHYHKPRYHHGRGYRGDRHYRSHRYRGRYGSRHSYRYGRRGYR